MTPNEFKAWFDGFTEAFDGKIPTKAQWVRIKERVAEIDGKPVTERIFVDRYWPFAIPQPYPTYYPWYNATCIVPQANLNTLHDGHSVTVTMPDFSSTHAMNMLGQLEAKSLS